MNDATVHATIQKAVERAINEMGLDAFKRTSMFLSNERVIGSLKQAA